MENDVFTVRPAQCSEYSDDMDELVREWIRRGRPPVFEIHTEDYDGPYCYVFANTAEEAVEKVCSASDAVEELQDYYESWMEEDEEDR